MTASNAVYLLRVFLHTNGNPIALDLVFVGDTEEGGAVERFSNVLRGMENQMATRDETPLFYAHNDGRVTVRGCDILAIECKEGTVQPQKTQGAGLMVPPPGLRL